MNALVEKGTFLATFELPERLKSLVIDPGERHIEYTPFYMMAAPELVWVSTHEQAAQRHQRDAAFPLGAR